MIRIWTGFALIVSLFAGASVAAVPVPAFTARVAVTRLKIGQTATGFVQEEPFLASSPHGGLYLSLPHTRSLFRSDDRGASWKTLFDTRSGVGQPNDGDPADGAILDAGLGVLHWLGMGGPRQIPYQRSTDFGAHWSAPVSFSQAANPDRQWIVGDSAGNVVAVWVADKTIGQVMLRHSHDNGSTWSDEQPITAESAYVGAPARGARNGEFFVPIELLSGPNAPCLALARSRDGGRTWTVVPGIRYLGGLVGLNQLAGPAIISFPFLAVDDADNVYITYTVPSMLNAYGSPLSPVAVYLSRSLDGGDTWSPSMRISGGFHNGMYGWPVAGARGHVAIAYYEDRTGLSREVPSLWSTRLAYSEDADTSHPHFAVGVVDAQAHVGTICNECGDFSRLDHLGIAALPDGQVVIAWDRDGPVNPRNVDVVTARTTNLRLR